MAKRFVDTQIWEKEWYMKLTPKAKCLWKYLTDRCDQSGVWEPNWQLASIYIGEPVTATDLKTLGRQIEVLKNGKIFIPDFVDFQYGRLSELSPAHKPVLKAIEKNNLTDRVFNRVSNTLQEKDKEKDKVMEEEKEMESADDWISWGKLIVAGNDQGWEAMRGRKVTKEEIDAFISVATRNTWTMETQQAFRLTLNGFKLNGQNGITARPNPGKT